MVRVVLVSQKTVRISSYLCSNQVCVQTKIDLYIVDYHYPVLHDYTDILQYIYTDYILDDYGNVYHV